MDEIALSLKTFFAEWHAWRQKQSFAFDAFSPIHAGWKYADEASLGHAVSTLLPMAALGHIGTVDERKIILLNLKERIENVPILQLMQLRPGSTDPLGLDHVAFYCANVEELTHFLQSSDISWETQSNPGHTWISLWFGPNKRDVKFFDHTSLDLGARELSEASANIIRSISD